jgi:ABC-type multidrug transport system fused ATPase/permease subunit
MEFGEVLGKAWRIIWQHKVLWIFGILAGCGQAGGSGGSNSGFRYSGQRANFGQLSPGLEQFFSQLNGTTVALIVAALIVFALVLFILAIVLGTIGRVGLIHGAQQVDGGAEKLVFGELFNYSMHYFWRVFGLNLLVGIVLFLLVIFIGIPISIITCGLGAIALVIFLILVPLVIELAIIAIVVEDLGILDGLKRGWEVFKTNLGNVIILGIILFVITLVIGFIIALPVVIVVAPVIFGLIVGANNFLNGGLLFAGLCFVAYLPVLLLLSGILRGYVETTWTLTFLRLTHKPVVPELVAAPEEPAV